MATTITAAAAVSMGTITLATIITLATTIILTMLAFTQEAAAFFIIITTTTTIIIHPATLAFTAAASTAVACITCIQARTQASLQFG